MMTEATSHTNDAQTSTIAPGVGPNDPDVTIDLDKLAPLNWESRDDPENPLNWSTARKMYQLVISSLMGFSTTFGVSVYSVAIDDVAKHFHVSREAATIPLTLFIIGQAVGPMIAAPLSEQYGRKSVLIYPSFIGLLFTLGCGLAPNFGALCVLRFLSGTAGSPALSVGSGVISDVLQPVNRSVGTAVMNISPFLGTALGPIIGGYVVQAKGWRWSQWLILFIYSPVWVGSLFMSETYKKAPVAVQQGGTDSSMFDHTYSTFVQVLRRTITTTLFRPLKMLLLEPIVLAFAIYVAFNFSVLFSFFDAFPVVFSGVYGFNLGESGLAFIAVAAGVLFELPIYLYMDRVTYQKKLGIVAKSNDNKTPASLAPEERLYPALLGSVLVPIGLFLFAWLSRADIHWIGPAIATAIFACGNLLVFCCCMLYLIDTYGPLYGASAIGANGLLRYTLGAASPLYTTQMYHTLGVHWASSLLAFITVGLMPIPWILVKFGPQIRKKSRYIV